MVNAQPPYSKKATSNVAQEVSQESKIINIVQHSLMNVTEQDCSPFKKRAEKEKAMLQIAIQLFRQSAVCNGYPFHSWF